MKIQTKYHGEVEVAEDTFIHFEKGLPGFSDEKSFVILPLPEQSSFSILQSVDTAGLAFVVANPYHFFPTYEFAMDEHTVDVLAIEDPSDVSVIVILTIQTPFEQTTANLQAPIIIHVKSNQAKQVILNDERYHTKHCLLAEKNEG